MSAVLTVEELAEELHISQQKARELIEAGTIPSVRLGPRIVRVPKAAIAALLSPATPANRE